MIPHLNVAVIQLCYTLTALRQDVQSGLLKTRTHPLKLNAIRKGVLFENFTFITQGRSIILQERHAAAMHGTGGENFFKEI